MALSSSTRALSRSTAQPGNETTFTIFLPAQAVALGVAVPELSPLVRGGNETILVAEDEASLRDLASTVLERLGYTVILAEDGLEAVNLFKAYQSRIDLVILDLVMPRFSGRDALDRMRAIRPDLRALFVTGYDEVGARARRDARLWPVQAAAKAVSG